MVFKYCFINFQAYRTLCVAISLLFSQQVAALSSYGVVLDKWDADPDATENYGYGSIIRHVETREPHSLYSGLGLARGGYTEETDPFASAMMDYSSRSFYCDEVADCNTTSNHLMESEFWYTARFDSVIDEPIPLKIDYILKIQIDLDPAATGFVSGGSEASLSLFELDASGAFANQIFFNEYRDELSSSSVSVTSGQTKLLTTTQYLKPNTDYHVVLGALAWMSLHPYLEEVNGFVAAYADPIFTVDPTWAFADQVTARYSLPNEVLTYDAPPSVVPVPTAAWLFGSGLIGLIGIARREKS